VQEKVAIEAVLKASTPLEDLSDVEALDSHLRNMAYKSEISMQEIKRLNEELRGILSIVFFCACRQALSSIVQHILMSRLLIIAPRR
jgi:hypothetical protein